MSTRQKLISMLSVAFFIAAATGAEPIFYCNFDDTLEPVQAMGSKNPQLETPAVFRPGVKGKALLIGLDEQNIRRGVQYSHEKNLNWIQGTISFWVKPVNWKGTDTGFFAPFFSTWAGKNNFYIYKFHTGENFYFMRGELGFWLFSNYRLGEWKKGQWHHVACSWDPVQLVIYIDGQLATERRIDFPLKNMTPKRDFIIGENEKTLKNKTGRRSLIDEFRIFDRVLSRDDIIALYRQDKPAGIPPKGLVTVPYGKNSFTGSGFTDLKTDEYAVQQNVYTLSFDDRKLYVSLRNPVQGAKAVLTDPTGKKYVFELKKGKAEIALAPLGLKPGAEGWILNLISGNTDLRGGLRLRLDKEMPSMCFQPPYDLSRNVLDLNVSPAPGFKMIFDRDTTFNYGFNRLNIRLDKHYSFMQKNIADWTLVCLVFEKNGKEYFRTVLGVRKNQPAAVKFLYTKIKERQLFVAFQGKTDGYAVADYCDPTGKTVIRSEKVKIPENALSFYNMLFPMELQPGNYLIKICHLSPKGKKTFLWDQELRVPPKNDPLIAPYVDPDKDKLPPGGWTPVTADNDSVKIWGRTLKLDRGLLFSSLVTQGKELLAKPDALRLNGKKLEPVSTSVRKISRTDLEAVFEKTVDYGEIKAESRIRITFDGYARITLKLTPAKPLKIRELTYELPMENERLKLVRDSASISIIAGLAKDGFTASLLPIPAIWIGDYYTGINFTAENLINWHFRNPRRHVEMKRNEKSADVRFLLVSAPLTLKKPREFNFGLTVTPVKPLNGKLLRQRNKKEWQTLAPWKYCTYLHPDNLRTDPPYRGMDTFYTQHRLFPTLFLYSAYNFTSPFLPFWTWYEENWRQIKYTKNYGAWTGVKPHADCTGCINGADFRNYKLNMTHNFLYMKNNPMLIPGSRNLYYDAPWEESCYNEKHGCKPWRDSMGQIRTHILIDVFRDKALNLLRMIKRFEPNSILYYHSEWAKLQPFQSLHDAMCGGEGQENQIAANNGYYDILTPASFNASFSPYIYSAKMAFIPQVYRGLQLNYPAKFRTWDEKNPIWRKAVLHYIGLAAVHDVDLLDRRSELNRLWWKAQDELGWNEKTEFHPYYADDPALKITPVSERIVASAYTNSGRLMLAVLNDTDQEQEISISLDLKKLQVKPGLEGHDAFEPDLKWTLSDEWKGKIGPRGFRLIVFK